MNCHTYGDSQLRVYSVQFERIRKAALGRHIISLSFLCVDSPFPSYTKGRERRNAYDSVSPYSAFRNATSKILRWNIHICVCNKVLEVGADGDRLKISRLEH